MKRVLAERYRDDRQRYTEEKGPLIWQIMGNADRWSQEIGWVAGASDA
jgi:GrpB-like predicted nucleotidyltransferase (UPF0157 family)